MVQVIIIARSDANIIYDIYACVVFLLMEEMDTKYTTTCTVATTIIFCAKFRLLVHQCSVSLFTRVHSCP